MAKSLDGVLTKKAHTKETFSELQVQDLLMCADPVEGYMYFVKNFFHIQHPTRGKVKFEPYTYQNRLLHSYHNYRFNINIIVIIKLSKQYYQYRYVSDEYTYNSKIFSRFNRRAVKIQNNKIRDYQLNQL